MGHDNGPYEHTIWYGRFSNTWLAKFVPSIKKNASSTQCRWLKVDEAEIEEVRIMPNVAQSSEN
jgi:hypothetical protein